MPIAKGQPWGEAAPLPADGVVVGDDGQARAALERARRQHRPFPVLGLLGGDLCRTLGGRGDAERLRSPEAMTFPVDVGELEVEDAVHLFLAHAVCRSRWWRSAVVAMNAQWLGTWNVGWRAHPNDGLLDVYQAHLELSDLGKVRRRLPSGSFLPHPRIHERRVAEHTVELDHPLPVWLDGERIGATRRLAIRVLPDAARVVV